MSSGDNDSLKSPLPESMNRHAQLEARMSMMEAQNREMIEVMRQLLNQRAGSQRRPGDDAAESMRDHRDKSESKTERIKFKQSPPTKFSGSSRAGEQSYAEWTFDFKIYANTMHQSLRRVLEWAEDSKGEEISRKQYEEMGFPVDYSECTQIMGGVICANITGFIIEWSPYNR